MSNIALVESHYLPSLAYFAAIHHCPKIALDIDESYIKQTYRNRCYILGANKIQALSVPVHRDSGKVPTRDVRIAYETHWQNNHWRSLASAYGKTPYFDHFADEFKDILYRPYRYLIDLNLALLTKCLDLLQWEHDITYSEEDSLYLEKSSVYDYRRQILIPEIRFKNYKFRPIRYIQAFGKDFVPNLSVIDVLFCEGPQASQIIKRSISER
ncbi:MAG: WbqC family protein [Cyclobacteriaceae bacterium]